MEEVELEFDEPSHTYRYKGNIVSGVTSCISHIPEELKFNQHFIWKTELGTKVHHVCEAINVTGVRPRLEDLHEDLRPYVDAYCKFLDNAGFTIHHAEKRLFSRRHMFAGTADLIGVDCYGKRGIFDIKTVTTLTPPVALQLAAYKMAWNEWAKPGEEVESRWAIQLCPDGTYFLMQYTDPFDERVFVCKKIAYEWDKRNGMLKGGNGNGNNGNNGSTEESNGSGDGSGPTLGDRPSYL
jgi:hypothetical protein